MASQRGDCRIGIRNQRTRMDRLFVKQSDIFRSPSEAVGSSRKRLLLKLAVDGIGTQAKRKCWLLSEERQFSSYTITNHLVSSNSSAVGLVQVISGIRASNISQNKEAEIRSQWPKLLWDTHKDRVCGGRQ